MSLMHPTRCLYALASTCLVASTAAAQQRDTAATRRPDSARATAASRSSERDVLLEVPGLAVDSIALDVTDLRAHLSLDANAMNVVQLTAGLDLTSTKVHLGMTGIYTQTYFYTRLEKVTRIVERVIRTVDRNPAVFSQVMTVPRAAADTAVPPSRRP
jgi:hypothetical protein